MSGDGNKGLWTKDTIAGAVLGCVACIFVQAQLQGLADRLNSPMMNAALRWWPALLVVAGLILLSWKRPRLHRAKELTSRVLEAANERHQPRNDAA